MGEANYSVCPVDDALEEWKSIKRGSRPGEPVLLSRTRVTTWFWDTSPESDVDPSVPTFLNLKSRRDIHRSSFPDR